MKQKQSQKVVIHIGETKPKRRAPRRRAPPRGGAPPRPGGGGGGAGAGGAPSMPSDFFPRAPPTVILPSRTGPLVDSTAQLQQLIRPIEQQLLRLEQAAKPPAQPAQLSYVAEGKEEEKPTMKAIRDYMAQYIESLPMAPEPGFKSAVAATASSSTEPLMLETVDRGTQTRRTTTAETGTQYVVEEPPQPLVKAAGTEPLVDNVRPVETRPKKIEIDSDEEEKAPPPPPPKPREETQIFYSAGDIQRLRDQGKITREWLSKFQARRANDPTGLTLVGIASKLGRVISREDQRTLKKQELIDIILDFIKK